MELKKVTAREMANYLFVNKTKNPVIEFYASYDEDKDETHGAYKASVVEFTDSAVVLINYYGGGELFAFDITVDENEAELVAELEKYFSIQFFGDFVWAEEFIANDWIDVNTEMPERFALVRVKAANSASIHNGVEAVWTGSAWMRLKPSVDISSEVTHWRYVCEEN